jgi:hypothetical protein
MERKARRRVWTEEQTALLASAVLEFGEHNWAAVALVVGLDRLACRVRWTEAISKLNRARWEQEEERQLIWLVEEKRTDKVPWSYVAKALGTGRTGKQCQYKYNTMTKEPEHGAVKKLGKLLEKTMILLKPVDPGVQSHSEHWVDVESEAEEPDWQPETW